MGVIELDGVTYAVPGGRLLFGDVSFRVPHGRHVALVGANGTGKTTLLRLIAGEEAPAAGRIHVDAGVAFMRQFVAADVPGATVRDLLVANTPARLRPAAQRLRRAERAAAESADESVHLEYADALSAWGEMGGYDAEVLWDTCASAALGRRLHEVAERPLSTLSGGEQKHLALEVMFRSDAPILLLDEPDNFLDVDGKAWLERSMQASPKTMLYVSHDRELLARTSSRVVTLEASGAWTHPESFATYHEARQRRLDKIDQENRRFREERTRLEDSMKEMKRRAAISDVFASRAKAAVTKLERFERTQAPPQSASEQDIRMRLRGGRTGKIALRTRGLSLTGLVRPFDTEIWFGERVGVLGPNGTGKSHFLGLLAGEDVAHEGEWRLGARVDARMFSQTHDRPDLASAPLVDIMQERGIGLSAAMAGLKRYGLHPEARSPFALLSGGQQARFQILLLELDGPTMLLLDEPTDNLDVDSAEALEEGLAGYEGTVVAVTHDRWFMRLLDRFLFFDADGRVEELLESPYV